MSWSLKHSVLTPELYESVYHDISLWCINELANLPPKKVDGVQVNALLNFATFDLHTLMTPQGARHMLLLLKGEGTTQTVMLRIKELVVQLYIKYGDDVIDALRQRVYSAISNTYGISFDIEKELDVNNTFWLHPFIIRMYNEIKLNTEK